MEIMLLIIIFLSTLLLQSKRNSRVFDKVTVT